MKSFLPNISRSNSFPNLTALDTSINSLNITVRNSDAKVVSNETPSINRKNINKSQSEYNNHKKATTILTANDLNDVLANHQPQQYEPYRIIKITEIIEIDNGHEKIRKIITSHDDSTQTNNSSCGSSCGCACQQHQLSSGSAVTNDKTKKIIVKITGRKRSTSMDVHRNLLNMTTTISNADDALPKPYEFTNEYPLLSNSDFDTKTKGVAPLPPPPLYLQTTTPMNSILKKKKVIFKDSIPSNSDDCNELRKFVLRKSFQNSVTCSTDGVYSLGNEQKFKYDDLNETHNNDFYDDSHHTATLMSLYNDDYYFDYNYHCSQQQQAKPAYMSTFKQFYANSNYLDNDIAPSAPSQCDTTPHSPLYSFEPIAKHTNDEPQEKTQTVRPFRPFNMYNFTTTNPNVATEPQATTAHKSVNNYYNDYYKQLKLKNKPEF